MTMTLKEELEYNKKLVESAQKRVQELEALTTPVTSRNVRVNSKQIEYGGQWYTKSPAMSFTALCIENVHELNRVLEEAMLRNRALKITVELE